MKKLLFILIGLAAIILFVSMQIGSSYSVIRQAYGPSDGCGTPQLLCDYPNGVKVPEVDGLCYQKGMTGNHFFFRCKEQSIWDKIVIKAECYDTPDNLVCLGDLVVADSFSVDPSGFVSAYGKRFSLEEIENDSLFLIDEQTMEAKLIH